MQLFVASHEPPRVGNPAQAEIENRNELACDGDGILFFLKTYVYDFPYTCELETSDGDGIPHQMFLIGSTKWGTTPYQEI